VTVAAELQRRGELQRIGGAPYLHTLAANVPIAANAGFYAEIVREKAILRRLVDAGTKIVQIGYAGEGQVDDIVDRAQAEVYQITDRRTAEDYAPLSEIMTGVLDEIEAIGNREAGLYGVPTGFVDLDELTNGLHAGQMVIVAARPAMGKALALDTPLPTPSGWTTMAEIQVGDELYDAQGRPTRVVAATEVMHDRPCYEVEFSDGSRIVADAQHQWLTETRAARKSKWAADHPYNRARNQRIFPSVVTTEEIARTVRGAADQRANHAVVNAAPIAGSWQRLPIPPYVLGAWLGDCHSAGNRITCETNEIPMYIESYGLQVERKGRMLYSIKIPKDEANGATFPGLLREAGVLNNKHIPPAYLRAAEPLRRELLAGLMDTDGTVVKGVGCCQFAVTNQRLADDVYELVVSLGYRCGRTTKTVKGRSTESSTCYILNFSTTDDVFRLHRKQVTHKEERPSSTVRIGRRYVTAVRKVASVPVRCVQVDNPDHLYLAGRSMIPTHNSTLALDLCRAASIQNNLTSVFFSLEMTRSEITMRLLAAESKVPLNHIRNGNMSDDDWSKLARHMGRISGSPIFIDDSPNMTMMEIRAKARRLKQRHDLRLVVIDYMQLMTSGRKVESRQLEVSEFSRQIKLLAKELEVPIIALSQLNRGPEQRQDKRPMMSDLRESGCLTADTRLMRADTNAEISLGELMESGAGDIPVWSLDDRLKLVPRTLTHAFPSGVKSVFEVTLGSGRRVRATGNHPFLTYDGWMPLGELTIGSQVGSIRHVPPPLEVQQRSDDEVVQVAQQLGARRVGVTPTGDNHAASNLLDLRSDERFAPDWVFGLPKEQVGLFIRHTWTTEGRLDYDEDAEVALVSYASDSRRLVDDLARLLLRFNIATRVEEPGNSGDRERFRLYVEGCESQIHFLESFGAHEDPSAEAAEVLQRLRRTRLRAQIETIPAEVWHRVRQIMTGGEAEAEPPPDGDVLEGAPPRERMAEVAEAMGDADLEVMATNDVFWDRIVSIEALGPMEVFDATVLGTHNFVADCIPLHNSLEQDADMVILLHRDDVYEKESTRPGEADLIVAKHRNGATRDIVVAFQGHYSRFVDMAH
jgi:replicative DNA helicase